MEKVLIGKITSPSGLKGEVRVWNYSDRTQIWEETESFYVGDELRRLESLRQHKSVLVVKFEGMDSREDAEAARGREVFVTEADLPPLEEGEYYVRDLIGMEVVEAEDGSLAQGNGNAAGEGSGRPAAIVGRVTDVIQNTAQDLLEVETPEGKKVLIPRVVAFVRDIDPEERRITVVLQEGLMDL